MAEQEKEWWQQGFGYRVQAGTEIGGKKCSYSVITDEATGFTYYQDGDKSDIVLKSSVEVCGVIAQEKVPAKVIEAKNGDIEFLAPNGQITLKAKSIRIMGEAGDGEVTIQAGKVVEMDAPASRVKGTNIDITATNSASTATAPTTAPPATDRPDPTQTTTSTANHGQHRTLHRPVGAPRPPDLHRRHR